MKLIFIPVLVFSLVLPALIQQRISVRAGLITCAEGNVYLGNARLKGVEENNPTVSQGQRLRTDDGRVEVQLGPGSFLRMGENGILLLEDTRFTDVRLLIESGSVLIEIFEKFEDTKIRAVFKDTIIELKDTGLYRLDFADELLRVYGGKAWLAQGGISTTVNRGKSVNLENGLESTEFNLKQSDPLLEWSGRRSFDHFIDIIRTSNSYPKNWNIQYDGWAENENYGMRFRSQSLAERLDTTKSMNAFSDDLRREREQEERRREREQEKLMRDREREIRRQKREEIQRVIQ